MNRSVPDGIVVAHSDVSVTFHDTGHLVADVARGLTEVLIVTVGFVDGPLEAVLRLILVVGLILLAVR